MAERTVQVTEKMAKFIEWASGKGEDEIRRIIREHLTAMKEHAEKTGNTHKREETGWDEALEPNDGNEQWKNGGDCNLCRKIDYCINRCRANKLLKQVSTPLLYQAYLDENPEAAAEAAAAITPENMVKQLGVVQ